MHKEKVARGEQGIHRKFQGAMILTIIAFKEPDQNIRTSWEGMGTVNRKNEEKKRRIYLIPSKLPPLRCRERRKRIFILEAGFSSQSVVDFLSKADAFEQVCLLHPGI